MSLRQKLLFVFSFTVVLAVAAVAWIVSLQNTRGLHRSRPKHTAALVTSSGTNSTREPQDVAARIDQTRGQRTLARIAYDLGAARC